ncbi:MAG: hypothetical protein JSS27_07445 [Planctomycetes bacterium]|nr:hypothetical protein [Planctomycetota bacterium]
MVRFGRGLRRWLGSTTTVVSSVASPAVAWAQEQAEPAADGWNHERKRLLIVLVCVGVLFGLLIWLVDWGARFTRKRIGPRPSPSRMGPDNWAAKRFLKFDRYRRAKSAETDETAEE